MLLALPRLTHDSTCVLPHGRSLAGMASNDDDGDTIKSSTAQDAEDYFAQVRANKDALSCEQGPLASDKPMAAVSAVDAKVNDQDDSDALNDLTWSTLPVRRGPTGMLAQSMQELD
jgi:hypothetical protein